MARTLNFYQSHFGDTENTVMKATLMNKATKVFGLCRYDQLQTRLVYSSVGEVKVFLENYRAERGDFYRTLGVHPNQSGDRNLLLSISKTVERALRFRKLVDAELVQYENQGLRQLASQALVADDETEYILLALAQLLGDHFVSTNTNWHWVELVKKSPRLLDFGLPVVQALPDDVSPIQSVYAASNSSINLAPENFSNHILRVLQFWLGP